jgi:hypothetical protein
MKKKKITKQRMAELMKTSRAQVDRLLDPDNGSATMESLQRAAKIGRTRVAAAVGVAASAWRGWYAADRFVTHEKARQRRANSLISLSKSGCGDRI